jgi:alkanesulfonate monooxygenase SsuD/methylene tetrahydromethanopterin reductase-like flavin-dependent oxidoreductase (luciferase family)
VNSPPGVLDGLELSEFRVGRLVGTVDEVRAQVAEWEALGVDTLVLGVGVVPFHVTSLDDVAMLGSACAR